MPVARPFGSRLAPAIASGHGLPSRKRVVLSFGHCTCARARQTGVSMFGAPKAISPATIEPVCATRSACVVGGEVLVRQVHQAGHAGVDRRDHRRAAHRVHVDLHADLLGFVHDRLEHFDLCLRRRGLRRQPDLTGVLDALRRQRLDRRARFGRRLPQVDLARRDDARADELALVDAVAQRDVGVGLPAAGEDRRVAGLEQRPHLRRRVLAVVDVLVAVDEAGHGAHALGVDDAQALRRCRAGGDRDDLAAAHDDGAGVDHLAAADDDPGIRDGHVLCCGRTRRDESNDQAHCYEEALHKRRMVARRQSMVD